MTMQKFDLVLPTMGGVVGAVVFLLLIVVVVITILRRRRRKQEPAAPDLRVDVSKLPAQGPSIAGPRLEFYGIPVRLAVLVLAPAGRGSSVPDGRSFEQALESLLPGLVEVVKAHRPLIRGWPYQLSTQGFVHAFFGNLALPGDHGKGTPWCAAAGRFQAGDQQLLAGLICVADKPNALSQVTIQQLGLWLDVLRVKGAS
ncbi:MAG: hypothetical protein NTY19_11695 [Planctomycetota bacterium]|nr:hypothetical protein [Planctomycetota bacterium]